MASSSSCELLGLVVESLPPSVKEIGKTLTKFWTYVEASRSNAVATVSSTAACKNVGMSIRIVGQNVVAFRGNVDHGIAAIQSSVAKKISDLRRNVQRNVQILTYKDVVSLQTRGGSSMSSVSSSRSPWKDVAEGAFEPRDQSFPSISLGSILSDKTDSDGVDEDIHHPDLSVSSTTVFSIGSLGVPLLGPLESQSLGVSQQNIVPEDALYVAKLGSLEMSEDPLSYTSDAPLWVVDARRMVGNALVFYKNIRSLGLQENSWENKMPWRDPPPAFLAKDLERPRKHFSSAREKYEYHRRARKRKPFLYGPLPGWSWIAADVLLLAFLIHNPAGETMTM